MRKTLKILFLCAFCCNSAFAQDFRTGYFLDNYLYDYRINPAMTGDSFDGFVSIGIGNATVGVQASFPMCPFIYKENGSYNFGIDKNFSLEKLHDITSNFNKANVSINENIFAMGWNRGRNAGTLEVNLRSYTSAYFDYELVRMAYSEDEGLPYSIENTKASTRNWLEVAYGFSSNLSGNLSFGARIKGLIGLNYSELNMPGLFCSESGSFTHPGMVDAFGSFRSTNTFLTFPVSNESIALRPDFGRYTIGGVGAAADVGLKITTERDIEITVAVLDIGGLMWHNKICGAQTEDRYIDSMDEVMKFAVTEPDSPASFIMNPVTVEAGARYPISENLTAGTLATIRIDNTARGWYEIRVGGSYSPAKAFSIAASAAMNTLGAGLGFAMNLRVPGIAFTLGTDSLFGLFSLNSDFVPARKLNTNLHLGLSVAW